MKHKLKVNSYFLCQSKFLAQIVIIVVDVVTSSVYLLKYYCQILFVLALKNCGKLYCFGRYKPQTILNLTYHLLHCLVLLHKIESKITRLYSFVIAPLRKFKNLDSWIFYNFC